jgi:uncharacterized membrane protein
MAADQPIVAILVMAAAAYLTRIAGYFLMGYVRVTPRVEAWLAALPISVMAAVLAPQAAAAGVPEAAGFAATLGVYAALRNEIVGAMAGVAAVALLRFLLG